jgi:nucleoid-associated protein YgaU
MASTAQKTKQAKKSQVKRSLTYVVKSGDTLSGIAEWFKLHGYTGLYDWNKSVIGSNPNLIFPGQRITISDGVMTLSGTRS